jgi:hypothetical protein
MKARSYNSRSPVESLEGRSLMSTVAYGDFNNDGREDMAAVTNPTTITVSLANEDGSYAVSAILTTPKGKTISDVRVSNIDGDGSLDVYAVTYYDGGWYTHTWLGNGDGTFDARKSNRVSWPPKPSHGGTW